MGSVRAAVFDDISQSSSWQLACHARSLGVAEATLWVWLSICSLAAVFDMAAGRAHACHTSGVHMQRQWHQSEQEFAQFMLL